MPTKLDATLVIPAGLCPMGQSAAEMILGVLIRKDAAWTGGCRAFFTPKEWREKGHDGVEGAVLIVVHDGGAVGGFFNYDRADLYDQMADALRDVGVYAESGALWYTGIWPIPTHTA